MKQLIIIRHAKTEVQQIGQDDFSRKLTERGKRNAVEIGRFLKLNKFIPDVMLVSSARRTQSTAKRIAEEIGMKAGDLRVSDAIYNAGLQALLYCLAEVAEENDTVCIVGHNPGVHLLTEWFLPFPVSHLVPGAVVVIDFSGAESNLKKGHEGRLKLIRFPDKE